MERLKTLEMLFLRDYPLGFESEEMLVMGKKHNIDKLSTYVNEQFSIDNFKNGPLIIEAYKKMMSRASMVSRFEKPKIKNFIDNLSEIEPLVEILYALLYEDEETGFNLLVEYLQPHKLDKWPIVSALLAYLNPQEEVFIKPTTVKNILDYFEIEAIKYSSKPSYEFYKAYRTFINHLKKDVPQVLKPNNLAFCGFLMMTIDR